MVRRVGRQSSPALLLLVLLLVAVLLVLLVLPLVALLVVQLTVLVLALMPPLRKPPSCSTLMRLTPRCLTALLLHADRRPTFGHARVTMHIRMPNYGLQAC